MFLQVIIGALVGYSGESITVLIPVILLFSLLRGTYHVFVQQDGSYQRWIDNLDMMPATPRINYILLCLGFEAPIGLVAYGATYYLFHVL
mgnify:CR=1 FL=1